MKFVSFKRIAVMAVILFVLMAGLSILSILQVNNIMNTYSSFLRNVSSADGIKTLQADLENVQASWNWMLLIGIIVAIVGATGLGVLFYRIFSHLLKILKTLQMMSNRLSAVTRQILLSAEKQENVSTQQSTSINETSNTIEQLSASTKNVVENARQVTQQVENASQRVLILSEKAQEIGKITTTIGEITQEINLLSLNAAIEAARAGEHGRGFSVVASEIRKLAENTNRAAEDIGSLISDIQTSTGSAVLSIEQAVDGVKRISRSVQQQESATTRIISAVGKVNDSMKQNVEGIQQTVSAVEELNNLSNQMLDIVSKFRLNGKTNGGSQAIIHPLENPLYQNG